MTQVKLNAILEQHKLWLLSNFEKGKCADLHGANLQDADLHGADLHDADLRGANLRGANLRGADLRGADLQDANLQDANLQDANLCGVDLYGANLCGADLYGANLRVANLYGADLQDANLYGADLQDANLYGADLCGANLRGASNIPFIPLGIPEGEIIVYKKCQDYIIKLKLFEDSKRLRATTYKCRTDKALVLEIQNIDGTKANVIEAQSTYDLTFSYKVGEIVTPTNGFDEDRWCERGPGIHFFMDRQLAVGY